MFAAVSFFLFVVEAGASEKTRLAQVPRTVTYWCIFHFHRQHRRRVSIEGEWPLDTLRQNDPANEFRAQDDGYKVIVWPTHWRAQRPERYSARILGRDSQILATQNAELLAPLSLTAGAPPGSVSVKCMPLASELLLNPE